MKDISNKIAGICCITAGVYLCLHDFPVLGGCVCIIALIGTLNFE